MQDLASRGSFILFAVILSSCTTSPTIKRGADGSYEANAGSTFMASRSGVIAEVKTREGDHIKFVAKVEDSTKVPISFLRTAGTAVAGWIYGQSVQAAELTSQVASQEATKQAVNASNNATAVELGAQGVQKTALGMEATAIPK